MADVARGAGVHITTVSLALRNHPRISITRRNQIRKLAIALSVSADMLLFEKDERGSDEDLKLQFELWRGWTRRRRESSDL